MQARFAGTCRDCGNRFPAGTDIDWQKGQGASCCNGTQYPSPGHEYSPGVEERLAGLPDPRPQAKSPSSPLVVDGAQRMEWVEGKTTQEVVGFQGDSLIYSETEYKGYNWMCLGCRLVWERQHQAINCEKRGHVASFEQSYGGTVWDGRGFMPAGGLERGKYIPGTGATYTRTAVRREPSPDAPPVAPAPAPSYNQVEEPEALHCELCGEPFQPLDDPRLNECSMCIDIRNIELDRVEEPAAQADPQDMTSEEMWDALTSPGTVTTTWN